MSITTPTLCLILGGLAFVLPPKAQEPAPTPVSPTRVGSDDWPLFRRDVGLAGVAAGELPDELDVAWTFQAGGAITSSPAYVRGWVYFGSDDGKVYCLAGADGSKLWEFPTDDLIEAPPLVVDGKVYIGSNDAWFYALDAETGELLWKKETGDKILGGANFHRTEEGLIIVVGSYDANLYGFDANSGEQLWVYTTDNYVNGTPAIHAGKAIFGGCDAILHVVDVQTGERVSGLELGTECHVAGSAAFVDGRAYFGHYGNQFVCVDIAKGESVWSYDSPRHAFFSSPSITSDKVVFGGRDRALHCAERATGAPLWTFKTRRKVDGSPVVAGDKVVFGSGDGRMYLLDLATGKELWSYDIGKSIIASPAVVMGRVYIGANDGRLYCFAEPTPKDRKDDK